MTGASAWRSKCCRVSASWSASDPGHNASRRRTHSPRSPSTISRMVMESASPSRLAAAGDEEGYRPPQLAGRDELIVERLPANDVLPAHEAPIAGGARPGAQAHHVVDGRRIPNHQPSLLDRNVR